MPRTPQPSSEATKRKKATITPGSRDKILKEAFAKYAVLTAYQVTRLLYPTPKLGNLTTIKDRLKQLTDAKLLHSLHFPTTEGQRPFVYFLSLAGRKYLKDEDIDILVSSEKADIQTRSYGWYMHLLELNDFLISAHILEKTVPQIHLFDRQHDFEISKHPPQGLNSKGKVLQVNPDGFLDFRLTRSDNSKARYCFLVEFDRDNHSDERIKKKIRDFLEAREKNIIQTHFGTKEPVYLFVTSSGARRVEKLRSLARLELKAINEKVNETSYSNKIIKFASTPPFMQPPLDPKTLFCAPTWLMPYGDPDKLHSLLDLS